MQGRNGEFFNLRFDSRVETVLAEAGDVPLPPYIDRPADDDDRQRYQTVYARESGAVAAPTAGLHFDNAVLDALADRGVGIRALTLHVGAGTFQNLRAEQLETGRLHRERIEVGADVVDAIAATRAAGGRVVAVGTTTVRALESAAIDGALRPRRGETDLFIRPGFRFRIVDGLITNFHLPGSSLLMLVAAFAGLDKVLQAYRSAIDGGYRFFSYGDAMFAWRHPGDGGQ